MGAAFVREDKPENGWVAEGCDLLAQQSLRVARRRFGSSYATLGARMSRDSWPALKTDVARRAGEGDWPSTFLHLTAESAIMALRDLDALDEIWRKALDVAGDRRSPLPAAVEMPHRIPPKQLAAELAVTDLAATGTLRQLRVAGIAREATGRQGFRAFTLKLWENAPAISARVPATRWYQMGHSGDDVTAMQRRAKAPRGWMRQSTRRPVRTPRRLAAQTCRKG